MVRMALGPSVWLALLRAPAVWRRLAARKAARARRAWILSRRKQPQSSIQPPTLPPLPPTTTTSPATSAPLPKKPTVRIKHPRSPRRTDPPIPSDPPIPPDPPLPASNIPDPPSAVPQYLFDGLQTNLASPCFKLGSWAANGAGNGSTTVTPLGKSSAEVTCTLTWTSVPGVRGKLRLAGSRAPPGPTMATTAGAQERESAREQTAS